MAAKTGLTKSTSFTTVTAREVDFTTRFSDNWESLRKIMGIMRPIRKTPGTKLKSYETVAKTALQGGKTVGEGEEIPFTEFEVKEKSYADIEIAKYAKSVSIEAVNKYGAAIAVEKTDDRFLVELQNAVLNDFYAFLKTGTLKGTQKTWQRALAIAKGAVLEKFAAINKDVTEIIGFCNIMDFYDYLGDKDITVQTQFGLSYVKNYLGYSTLFLMPSNVIESKTVIAVPSENIDLYYIDPSDSDFAKLGLDYRTSGETNLIGFHAEPDYSRATGDSYAIMGMKLWAEYLDGIAIVTVGASNTAPTVTPTNKDTQNAGPKG